MIGLGTLCRSSPKQSEEMLCVLVAVLGFHGIANGRHRSGAIEIVVQAPLPVGTCLLPIWIGNTRRGALPAICANISVWVPSWRDSQFGSLLLCNWIVAEVLLPLSQRRAVWLPLRETCSTLTRFREDRPDAVLSGLSPLAISWSTCIVGGFVQPPIPSRMPGCQPSIATSWIEDSCLTALIRISVAFWISAWVIRRALVPSTASGSYRRVIALLTVQS